MVPPGVGPRPGGVQAAGGEPRQGGDLRQGPPPPLLALSQECRHRRMAGVLAGVRGAVQAQAAGVGEEGMRSRAAALHAMLAHLQDVGLGGKVHT